MNFHFPYHYFSSQSEVMIQQCMVFWQLQLEIINGEVARNDYVIVYGSPENWLSEEWGKS